MLGRVGRETEYVLYRMSHDACLQYGLGLFYSALHLSLIHPRAFFSQSTGPSLRSDTVACVYYICPENLSNVIFHVITAISERSSGFAITNKMQSRTKHYNHQTTRAVLVDHCTLSRTQFLLMYTHTCMLLTKTAIVDHY